MNCTISKTYNKLVKVFKNPTVAKEKYNKLSSLNFLKVFGDWKNIDSNNFDPEGKRLNDQGEPLLYTEIRNGKSIHYFLDKENNHIDITPRNFEYLNVDNRSTKIKEVVNIIAAEIFNENIKNNFNDLESIKNINIEKYINNFIQSTLSSAKDLKTGLENLLTFSDKQLLEDFDTNKDEINSEIILNDERIRISEGLEHGKADLKNEIISYFISKGLTINDKTNEIEEEKEKDDNSDRGEAVNSVEKNSKNKAGANVKLLLSFLRAYEIDPNYNITQGNSMFIPMLTDVFEQSKFIEGNAVHEDLLRLLANVVPNMVGGKIEDVFVKMISLIKNEIKIKPHYEDLINLLESEEYNQNKKSEFVVAMTHFKNQHMVYENNIIKGVFKAFDAAKQSSVESKILKNWQEKINKVFIKNGKIDTALLQSLSNEFKDSFKRFNDIFSGEDLSIMTDDDFSLAYSRSVLNKKKGLISIFNKLGINNIDDFVMHSMLIENANTDTFKSDVKIQITDLYGALNLALKDFTKNQNNEDYSFIENNKSRLFNDLAVYTAKTQNDVKDSTVYSMNKMFWVYGNASFLSNTINLFKENKDLLRNLKKNAINGHTLFADYLLAEDLRADGTYVYSEKNREIESNKRLEEFSATRFLQYQEEFKSKDAVDNKSVSVIDQIISRFGGVMGASVTNLNTNELTQSVKPIYSTILPADKNTAYEIKIGLFMNETLAEMKSFEDMDFSKKTKDIFYNYFTDEYNRMVEAYDDLKNKEYSKLKIHYHTDKGGNIGSYKDNNGKDIFLKTFEEYENSKETSKKLLGQAFVSQISPEINYNTLQSKLVGSNIFNKDGSPSYLEKDSLNEDHKDVITNILNKMMTNRVGDNVTDLMSKGIIKKTGENAYTFAAIDNQIRRSYGAEKGVFTRASLYQMVSDYAINTIIANVEYTKLFTGDPAYYKNMVDFFKRVPATYTDGTYLRLGLTEGDETFNMSVVENQIVDSKFYDNLDDSLKLAGIEKESERKSIIGAYKEGVNQTDAQAWITPMRWKFILERTGKWTDAHNVVYDKMIEKNKEPFTSSELKLSAQPLKGVYYGVVNGAPTYMKYSQAVLTPMLVKGSKLESFYNQMIEQKIDEAVTLDGVKVGADIPTDISGDKINFNIQVLNNFEWKLQQDLPVKLMKQTLLGSQIQKNIYSTVKKDEVYDVDGVDYQGFGIIDHINSILSDLSNNGINKLSKLLEKGADNKINSDKMYDIIQGEINDNPEDYTDNMKDAVNKKMLIEAMPSMRDKMYSILFSKIRKAASNIKTNGGSFIQMSNYGLDIVTADEQGVTWLAEKNELKPPTLYEDIVTNEDGTKITTIKQRPGQIFISHSDIAKAIPNYRQLAKEGKLKDMLGKDVLKAIGYRIPNQGMSSNDALEIVGILPPHMNDTIVAYTEITTKTGSDFDIDKMFVMLPELKTLYTKKTYKAAKEYLKTLVKDNVSDTTDVFNITDFYDALVENTGIDLSQEEMVKLFSATDETLLNNDYFNIIVDHLVKGESEGAKALSESINEGGVRKIIKSESNRDSTKGLNNMLFDSYWSILTNKSTYSEIIKPIDFDYLQNHIKSLNSDKQVNENFKFYDGIYQVELKNTYMLGKSGVGISANMAVDHNISKNMVNLRFNGYNLGVGFINENNETVFDNNPDTGNSNSVKLTVNQAKIAAARIKEKTGKSVNYETLMSFKIGDTISAFMNAFVDNAKDPYIELGNYNTYTSGVAFMLTRAGVHPYWTDAFMGQPILKELTKFTKDFESISVKKDDKYKSMSSYDAMLYDAVANLINTNNKKLIIAEIEKLKNQKRIVYSYEDLANNYNEKDDKRKNVELLMTFKEYQDQSKKLDASVNLSRFDTLGSGRNFSDMLVYQNNLLKLFNKQETKGEINGHMDKYIRDGVLTSLGSQLKNSVFFASDVLNANPSIFLSANKEFLNVIDNISMTTAGSYGGSMGRSSDKKMISKLSKELYTSLMSKYEVLEVEGNPVEFVKNVKERLVAYKDNKNENSDNAFVNSLTFYNESFGIDIGRLEVNQKNDISNAFYDIYKQDFKLAKDIIKASFLMNGFNQSLIDFNEMIPHEFFLNYHKINNTKFQSVQAFIKEKMNEMGNSSYAQSFHKEYAQNNYDDNKLVRQINSDLIQKIGNNTNNLVFIKELGAQKSYQVSSREDEFGVVDKSTISYTPYIKTETNSKNLDANTTFLYEYKGNMKFNKEYRPVYEQIELKGYKNKSSKVNYKEYGKENSSFEINNFGVNPIKDNANKQLAIFEFVDMSKTSHFLETQEYKNTNQLKDLIFNNEIKESEETVESQENNVSLQNVNVETIKIYSQLGNKTATDNVVLKSVYQKAGVAYAKSIDGVFSMRVNNSNTHFGNPFSSVPTEIAKGLIATKSTKESVKAYISWIFDNGDVNNAFAEKYLNNLDGTIYNKLNERKEWIQEQLKSGVLKDKAIVYYKELGEPSHATALDYLINNKTDENIVSLQESNDKLIPNKTINVYYGQAESEKSTKILSNLASRKFTYESVDGIFREYGSVEHAYQTNKNGNFNKTIYDNYVKIGGYGKKITTKLTEKGKKGNLEIMKDLVVESFLQNKNSEAAIKLLEYNKFTHNTNQLIDKAFLKGLYLAQKELLNVNNEQKEGEQLDLFGENDVPNEPQC